MPERSRLSERDSFDDTDWTLAGGFLWRLSRSWTIGAVYRQGPQVEVDWLHTNGIDYNAEYDLIVLSVPRMNELWVIDHSTTTEEALGSTGGRWGKGGDLLWRWGNPRT